MYIYIYIERERERVREKERGSALFNIEGQPTPPCDRLSTSCSVKRTGFGTENCECRFRYVRSMFMYQYNLDKCQQHKS